MHGCFTNEGSENAHTRRGGHLEGQALDSSRSQSKKRHSYTDRNWYSNFKKKKIKLYFALVPHLQSKPFKIFTTCTRAAAYNSKSKKLLGSQVKETGNQSHSIPQEHTLPSQHLCASRRKLEEQEGHGPTAGLAGWCGGVPTLAPPWAGPAEALQSHRAALLARSQGLQLTRPGTTLPTNTWGLSPRKGSQKKKCIVPQTATTASASITL